MRTKHKIALGLVTGAAILSGAYGAAHAVAATSACTNEFPPIVQKMVEKFNLNKDEVKTLMEEDRAEREAERKKDFEAKLTDAVTNGKITEAQKEAILAKHNEMQTKMEELKDLTGEERRTQMEALRSEMQTWVKEQGIDEAVMPMFGKHGEGRGMRRGMMEDRE